MRQLENWLASEMDDGMLLSELDGFLTGLILSPDLIPQSKWLDPIWRGAPPALIRAEDLQQFLDLLVQHHNTIIDNLNRPGTYSPILDTDARTGEMLWELWLEGFAQAMRLAPAGWSRIRTSDDAGAKAALAGIAELAKAANHQSAEKLSNSQPEDEAVSSLLPIWIQLLHDWRLENDKYRPPSAKTGKVGRNDACPCGSGRKYKKCCGLN